MDEIPDNMLSGIPDNNYYEDLFLINRLLDAMSKILTIIVCLWGGTYFLYEAIAPFPDKDSLTSVEGELIFIGACIHTRRSGTKQRIRVSRSGVEVDFRIFCSDGMQKVDSKYIGRISNILYNHEYEFFIFPRVDVYDLEVDGIKISSYEQRAKFNGGASQFAFILGILSLGTAGFLAYRHLTSQGSRTASPPAA